MWLRSLIGGLLQFFITQSARAEITLADFRTPLRYAADITLDVNLAIPLRVNQVIGTWGKAVLMKSDVDDRRRLGGTTPQALRDQSVVIGIQELTTLVPLGSFKLATKPLAIAASKAGLNTFAGNQIDWFYTSVQSSVAPYTSGWREKGRSVQGSHGGGRLGDSDCSTKLAVGQEVLSLAKELVQKGCGVQGMPTDRGVTSAQFTVSCSNGLTSQYGISKQSETQIAVTMQFLIAGQRATATSIYEKCESKNSE